ncbi:hypothetical protein VNO77_44721 [Canavalia gladiata]|uniref:Uncharacterized protein n=1 Tax=Canavalia gladiata TaxID=3824 RepID=A0AAN9JWH7_CANGL
MQQNPHTRRTILVVNGAPFDETTPRRLAQILQQVTWFDWSNQLPHMQGVMGSSPGVCLFPLNSKPLTCLSHAAARAPYMRHPAHAPPKKGFTKSGCGTHWWLTFRAHTIFTQAYRLNE